MDNGPCRKAVMQATSATPVTPKAVDEICSKLYSLSSQIYNKDIKKKKEIEVGDLKGIMYLTLKWLQTSKFYTVEFM